MTDVEVLDILSVAVSPADEGRNRRTLMPSEEKHGGTADDSSSASLSNIGKFSTADMGMSPL